MEHNYRFSYSRIVLLPLDAADIEKLRVLRNQERMYFLNSDLISKDGQKEWYETYLKKENDIMFKVVKKDNPDEFIGAIAVYNIDLKNSTAEIGRTVIDKVKAPEKGIGTEATRAAGRFAFDCLNIETIIGIVKKTNKRIITVDTRAGFYIAGDFDNDNYLLEMTRESLEMVY